MNPYHKAARSLLRLIAAGLLVVGALLGGLELLAHRARHTDLNWFKLGFYALLLLGGLGLFAGSHRLAARLTDEAEPAEDEDAPPPEP